MADRAELIARARALIATATGMHPKPPGCGNNPCTIAVAKGAMCTQGGCRCFLHLRDDGGRDHEYELRFRLALQQRHEALELLDALTRDA
jgi:hypothetical protein